MPFGRERGVGEGEEKGNRSRCHSGEGGGKKGIGEGVKKEGVGGCGKGGGSIEISRCLSGGRGSRGRVREGTGG